MTTYVDFSPNASASPPFSFQAMLDGAQYTIDVTWNAFGEGYYVGVSDSSGNLVLFRSMTSSGAKVQGTLSWADGTATAALAAPHNVLLGAVAQVGVSGTGLGYDGYWLALATGAQTLTYQLAGDPGQYGVTGNVSQDVDLAGGYFDSTLVFRDGTQQFEVNP